MNRRKSREVAMKMLYEMSITKSSIEETIANFKDTADSESDIKDVDFEYITRVIKGVNESNEAIDEAIKSHLVKWTLDRLPKMTKAILRISVFEILFDEEIPKNVSINEAVEVSKKYGDEKTPAFVNGLLNNISK